MKGVWKYTCGLSLGLLTSASGWAQEIQWHAAARPIAASPASGTVAEQPAPASLPIAISTPPPLPAGAVSLGTPMPVPAASKTTPAGVQPVACSAPAAEAEKVAVSLQPFEAPKPMPVGPTPPQPGGADVRDSLKMPAPLTGPVPPSGVVVPPGTVVPPGVTIPQGTEVPQGTVVPPGAVEVSPGTELPPGTVLAPGSEVPSEEGVSPGGELMAPGAECTGSGCCADDSGCVTGGEGLPEGCCLVDSDATADGHGRHHGHWRVGWHDGGDGGDGGDGWGWGWGGDPANDNALFLNAEVLLWGMKGNGTPALVTGSTSRGVGAGSLADPNAIVLYGGQRVDAGLFTGARFTAGYWFSDDHVLGVEGSFFFLGPRTQSFFLSSNGSPAIFRPFVNDNLGTPDALRIAYPGQHTGSIAIDQTTRLWGYEANALTSLLDDSPWRLNLLGGFRSVGLDQSQQITSQQTGLLTSSGRLVGGTLLSSDRFAAQNRFYGGQVGLQLGTNWGPWTFDLKGQVALGETNQTVDITGGTLINRGSGPQFIGSGVLAQPSNIGHYTRSVFGVVPEMGLTVGYQINDYLRVYAGYTFLYMNNVALPGTAIDTTINRNQLPPGLARQLPQTGMPRPVFVFRSQDFWAQGANVGLEFRY
jgi:hypothetical protein